MMNELTIDLVKSLADSLTVSFIFGDKKAFENFVKKFNEASPEFKKGVEIEGKDDNEKVNNCIKKVKEEFDKNRGEYELEKDAIYNALNKYFEFKV